MANNRDSSKQKRARQNRAQREARQARAEAASVPAEERKAKYASSAPAEPASSKKSRAADRPRPERKPRMGDVPVDIDTLEGNWWRKRLMVPGGRQVLTGTILTVIITILTVVNKYPDPDATGDARKELTHSFLDYYGPIGIPLVIIPLAAVLVASWFILAPQRRRIWTISAFVASIGAVAFGIPYAFPVGFLVYAVMRANKIEGPVPGSRAAKMLEQRQSAQSGTSTADAAADDDE